MAKKNEAIELLTYILKSIDLIGVTGTLTNVKRSINPFTFDRKKHIDFIVGKTCIYFQVAQEDLIFGKARGERVNARDACIWLLRRLDSLSYPDIDEIFSDTLSQPVISKSINRINALDKNIKTDRLILDKIKLIEYDFTKEYISGSNEAINKTNGK